MARARCEASGATVRELLDDLTARVPALGEKIYDGEEIKPYVNVYVDGEDVRTSGGLDAPGARKRDDRPPACDGRRMIAGSLLDLIGNTPLVALEQLSPEGVTIYAKLEAQNPTGSIKDRVALAMVDAAGLEPGAELLEPTSGNTGISLALVAKLRGHKLTCVMPANATPERRLVLELFGATIVDSPANEGSNGAVRLAQEMAAADPRYTMLFQYANEWNPRAHYEGTGAEIVRDLPRVDALVAGLGTGGTLMGTGARRARGVSRRRRGRGGAAARRSGDGPALARRRLRAADPRRVEARPQDPRLECRVGRGGACAARPGGDLRRRLRGSGRARRAADRRGAARPARSSWRCWPTAAGSTSPATSGRADDVERSMESTLWW